MKSRIPIITLCLIGCWFASGLASTAKPKRPKVHSVTFAGNVTYDDSRLEGLMLTRSSRFLATSRYHPDVFADDLETLMSFYRQNGFLQMRLVDTTVKVDSTENQVDIGIVIEENDRTHVEGVTVLSNVFFGDSTLLSLVPFGARDPLRRPAIEDAVVAMLSRYAEHGYLDAAINTDVRINDSTHLALVDFTVNEGPCSLVGSVVMAEGIRTRPNVIVRELEFSRGDTVRYSALVRSQKRLYLTGLFESAFVRPGPRESTDPSGLDIVVDLKERPSTELAFSLGYGTVEKARARAELNTINLAGTARKAGWGIEANFIRQGTSLSFSEPWTLGTRWKTDLSLFGQLKQEPSYSAEVVGGKLTAGRGLGAYTRLALSFRVENTNLSRVDAITAIEEIDPRIRSLGFNLSYDSRDNLFDPSTGWYIDWFSEMAGSFLRGSDTFVKSTIVIKGFGPLGRSVVIGSAVQLGWMAAFGESTDIPLSERFFAGGPTSLRGFGYQMVGPRDGAGEPTGGRLQLVCNLIEVRKAIYKMFGGVMFLELGNVWSAPDDFSLNDLRVDVGSGLRINSPLGIVRLDYGINLDRRQDEPRTKLHFSMGQAF